MLFLCILTYTTAPYIDYASRAGKNMSTKSRCPAEPSWGICFSQFCLTVCRLSIFSFDSLTDTALILPFVKYAYDLFNRCGYRHSDVACFGALYDEKTPSILKDIPYRVAWFEYEILQYLLTLGPNFKEKEVYDAVETKSKSVVEAVLAELKNADTIYDNNNETNAIQQYYLEVFSRINQIIA